MSSSIVIVKGAVSTATELGYPSSPQSTQRYGSLLSSASSGGLSTFN